MRAAADLDEKNLGKDVYISESAIFKAGKSKKEEFLLVWWNKTYADMLEVVPRGRGYGYYSPKRGASRFVEYEPDLAYLAEDDYEAEEEGEADDPAEEAEYATAPCDSCGKIVPLYELKDFITSEEVGRSSGSTRTGRTSSRRTSSKSYSYSSGSSSSSSSGRTYYKTITRRLCEECYKTHPLVIGLGWF